MKRIILAVIAVFVFFASHSLVVAGNFEDGVAAEKRGDFRTAIEKWKPLAEQGDVKAQYNLGVMYDNGHGVAQDYKEAVKWFRLAAEKGNARAQYNLGVMYDNGHGVAQDYKEAVKWFRLAAERGDVFAQYNLGVMYRDGKDVAQDYKEAVRWFRLAAEKGDVNAQFNIGLIYGNGQGVAQDYVEAHKWFNISGANGDMEGLECRDFVANKMTPSQIAKAQRLAKEWMEQHKQYNELRNLQNVKIPYTLKEWEEFPIESIYKMSDDVFDEFRIKLEMAHSYGEISKKKYEQIGNAIKDIADRRLKEIEEWSKSLINSK